MAAHSAHHSLPPKPSAAIVDPESSSTTLPIASTSASTHYLLLCAICTHQRSKYTCPGCSLRTCSVPCSSAHKGKTGCTGQRNKAAYVPMNQYSWSTMVDDYVYLEEVGRKVGDWGKEIVKGGYGNGTGVNNGNTRGRGDDRGRGRGNRGRGRDGGRGGGPAKTKRDVLKMQLEARDVDVGLLPAGMEKRKLNQSSWDFKNQTALLTIEFKFYKSKDPLAPYSQPRGPPFTLLTHRNDMKKNLLSLIRDHLRDANKSKKDNAYPQWARQLVFPDVADPEAFSNPQCVMATRLDPLTSRRLAAPAKRAYYSLDPTQALATVLCHTQFVEFPTIEVWDEFEGMIVDVKGVITQEEQRPPKKRRLNLTAGKIAIAGLVGGYGSSEEEEVKVHQNVLVALDEYASSEGSDADKGVKYDGEDDLDFDGLSEDDTVPEADPAALLELMRQARDGEPWVVEDEEVVDWGDMDDDEPEGH